MFQRISRREGKMGEIFLWRDKKEWAEFTFDTLYMTLPLWLVFWFLCLILFEKLLALSSILFFLSLFFFSLLFSFYPKIFDFKIGEKTKMLIENSFKFVCILFPIVVAFFTMFLFLSMGSFAEIIFSLYLFLSGILYIASGLVAGEKDVEK